MSVAHLSPIYLESHGRGDPPVVLVHGLGAHMGFWRKWVPHLEGRHRVHLVDLMGFGQAPTPWGGDYSPLAQAGHLAEVVRRLEGPPPVLVGHSLGAGIVVAATLRLLDEGGARLPGGLVLVSGALYPQRLPRFLTLARVPILGELFLLGPPPRAALRFGIRGIVAEPALVNREMVDVYREPLRSFRRRRAVLRTARQLSISDAEPIVARLLELQVPALLVWGEEDAIVPPASGERLRDALPNARLVTLPGVGHLPPEEAPEESVGPVLEFLARRREEPRVARAAPQRPPPPPADEAPSEAP